MHPLVPYGIGALLGALGYLFAAGVLERYQKIAFGAGTALALVGGGVLLALKLPPIPGAGRLVATAGLGLSLVLLGSNMAVMAQAGSGGFSSARDGARLGTVVAFVLFALSFSYARPA